MHGTHIILLVFLGFVACAASARSFIEFAHPIHVPNGWQRLDNAKGDSLVQLVFAVKQKNVDKLEEIFWAVSDPENPKYGEHLTLEQITELVSPGADVLNHITSWLASYGVSEHWIPLTGDFIKVTVSVETASKLLATSYHEFEHVSGARTLRAIQPYSLPEDIAALVDFVGGVHRFPQMNHLSKSLDDSDEPEVDASVVASNAPVSIYTPGSDAQMSSMFLVKCKDGNTTTDASSLCSQNGDAVSSFQFSASMSTRAPVILTVPVSQVQCMPCSNWAPVMFTRCNRYNQKMSYSNDTVYCYFSMTGLPNHVFLNFSIATNFGSGVQSTAFTAAPTYLTQWALPQSLKKAYNVPAGLVNTNRHNRGQAVATFYNSFFSPDDLKDFLTSSGLPYQNVTWVSARNDPTKPGSEASLDIQYIMAMSRNVRTWFMSYGSLDNGLEPFLDWLADLSNNSTPPYVHSISYADEESSLTVPYVQRLNVEFMKNGARGLTFVFASGDDGVGGYTLRGGPPAICDTFQPFYPASSPYVLSVGGTMYSENIYPMCRKFQAAQSYQCTEVGEVGSDVLTGGTITSGGGFSTFFKRPRYQDDAVRAYLQAQGDQLPASKWFNASNRAYPDVAANANNYIPIRGGLRRAGTAGTSASAPVVAGMITLLNDHRLNQGNSPLGFVNTLFYSLAQKHPEAFTDVVIGENRCTVDPDYCCPTGFNAAPGWDPVTGLGTLNFGILKELV